MSIKEISFPSANERDTVKAWRYTPIREPRAVIQLVHGFGEHSRRYLHMIDAFLEAGFVVYADDHIGHGKTAFDAGNLGDPGTRGVDGYLTYSKRHNRLRLQFQPIVLYFQAERGECFPCLQESIRLIRLNCLPKDNK